MKANYCIRVEQKDNLYYCTIPELKIFSKGVTIKEAYDKIEQLKANHLKMLTEYDQLQAEGLDWKMPLDKLKIIFIVLFFLLLAFGLGAHITTYYLKEISKSVDTLSTKVADNFSIPKSIKSMENLSPEQKKAKIERFEKKIENVRSLLADAKPFIEASKPLLRDIQKSFDLKSEKNEK